MKLDDANARVLDYRPQVRPVTGRQVLLIVLAFFGVIIAANMTMLYFAVTNFSGLVVKNSYVASQNFETDRARARAAALTGWNLETAAVSGAVELLVTDQAGAPVERAVLSGVIGRPSHDRADRPVAFVEIAPGRYRAETGLEPGAWRLMLRDASSPEVARATDFFAPASQPAPKGGGS